MGFNPADVERLLVAYHRRCCVCHRYCGVRMEIDHIVPKVGVELTHTISERPHKRTIVYETPFDLCDREKDYEIVWAEFEKRFGTTNNIKSNNA